MYSTTNISGCIILSSDICGFFFCKVMIVVVACVVSISPDALVKVVIFWILISCMFIFFLLLNALFKVVTKIIQCIFIYTCPCMYSTTNISG